MRSWFGRLSLPRACPPRRSVRLGVGELEARVVPAQHVTVAGTEFEDVNANGVRDVGEAGAAGWTVFADLDLNGILGPGEPFEVTDANGNYRLQVDLGMQANFRVMEQSQAGWSQTFDPAATLNEPTAAHPYYTLPFSDLNQRDIDFSNMRTDFVVASSGNLQTTETGLTASFTVVLTSQPTSDVTIPVSSSDASEGSTSTAQLIFTSADWNVPQTVTVTGQTDAVVDGNVVYTIDLGPSTSADLNYNSLPAKSVAVTNFDAAPVDKVGLVRPMAQQWTLDAFNDGVYSTGRDTRYTLLGGGQTIVGDWNGDGYDDIGLFRPFTGTFVLFVNGNVFKTVTMLDGKPGGVPLVGN